MNKQDQIRIEIANVSPLITKVEFAVIGGNETIYIHHNNENPNAYHCVHVSKRGLMLNSNGYHDLDVHDAMNEGVNIARKHLGF